jgi:hypothetical protein
LELVRVLNNHDNNINYSSSDKPSMAGQRSCSIQIVGTLGSELILLCLGNEPVTGAMWITPDGMRASNNITFSYLNTSNAGVYTCCDTIQEQTVSSIYIDLRISSELTDD